MKIPDTMTERCTKRWDGWQAFHWSRAPLTVFDTGEMVVSSPSVDQRMTYDSYALTVAASNDSHCPQLYLEPPGAIDRTTIPKAWLSDGGQQTLLIDHCTGQAVSLDSSIDPDEDTRPARFRNANGWARVRAYYPGPGLPPVGGRIELSVPLTSKAIVTEEQREHIETMRDVQKAEVALRGMTALPAYADPPGLEKLTAAADWRSLDVANRSRLYHHGNRVITSVCRLYI